MSRIFGHILALRPVWLACALLLSSVAAQAADMTWTAKIVIDAPIPLPPEVPQSLSMTVNGDRYAFQVGDQTMIFDAGKMTTVDDAKHEFSRRVLPKAGDAKAYDLKGLTDQLKAVGATLPKLTVRPLAPPQAGPDIMGVATTIHEIDATLGIDVPKAAAAGAGLPANMSADVQVQVWLGKPAGWEALRAAQAASAQAISGSAANAQAALMGSQMLSSLIGEEAAAEISRRDWSGFLMRMKIGINPKLPGAAQGLPFNIGVGLETTSLKQTADLSLFEIPKGYTEVPPPALPGFAAAEPR